jgi:hypothetical protein
MKEALTNTDQLRTEVANLTMNELCFDEDMFYDQSCYWGCRFGNHAVYCHNFGWKDKPMKCRKMFFGVKEIENEDCAGFKENEI